MCQRPSVVVRWVSLPVLLFFSATASLTPAPAKSDAATVTLELVTYGPGNNAHEPPGRWWLWGSASLDDSDGVSGFRVDLVGGAGDSRAIAPRAVSTTDFSLVGFIVGDNWFTGDEGTLYASQNPLEPDSILYGIGQYPGSINGYLSGSSVNVPWSAPVLLAMGTASDWRNVSFGAEVGVRVWSAGQALINGVATESANVQLIVRRIPEPSAANIAVLSAILVCHVFRRDTKSR